MLIDLYVFVVLTIVGILAAVPGMVALTAYVRGLSERIDDLESLRLLDAAERAQQHDELNELRRGLAILVAQIRRSGQTPEWTPAAMPSPVPISLRQTATDRMVEMWQKIAEYFDLEEQEELWFELGWGSAIRGDTAGERARMLVSHANRRGRLGDVETLCREKRPYGGF